MGYYIGLNTGDLEDTVENYVLKNILLRGERILDIAFLVSFWYKHEGGRLEKGARASIASRRACDGLLYQCCLRITKCPGSFFFTSKFNASAALLNFSRRI